MEEPKVEEVSKGKNADAMIGLKRIRTIMRSTADTGPINKEGLYIVSKATKLFIEYLAKGSYKHSKSDKLSYDNLAKMVNQDDKLGFLLPIVPQKITVQQYKEIIAKESDGDSSDDEDQSTEDEEAANRTQ